MQSGALPGLDFSLSLMGIPTLLLLAVIALALSFTKWRNSIITRVPGVVGVVVSSYLAWRIGIPDADLPKGKLFFYVPVWITLPIAALALFRSTIRKHDN